MKIGVSDPDRYTFSQQLIDHWESQGHEVVKSLYHEPGFVAECDVVFYDYASAMVKQLSEEGAKPKKCIVRAIDVENYMNYYKTFNWDLIDHFIVLNEAQKRMFKERPDFTCPEEKIHVISPGVNLDKFTLKQGLQTTNKAVFVGRFWIGKNVAGAIELVEILNSFGNEWTLHLRGQGLDPRWWDKYIKHKIECARFPIIIDDRQEDMNAYLEDKSLMIVSSFKEAFSYAGAEALAKGIPTVFNNWYGAEDVWPKEWIYSNPWDGALKAVEVGKLLPSELRHYIEERYDEKYMFERIDSLL